MGPCETYEFWGEIDRFEALRDLVSDALNEWGFDDVDFVNGEGPGGGAPGEYDDGIIYLDMDNEAFDDPETGMSIAYHEAMHAMLDQAGLSTFDLEEELEAGYLGARAADEALQGCECSEPVSSQPTGSEAPPFPWRCDLDSGF